VVASSAHAFTFGSAGASDGIAIVDPDDQVKSFGGGSSNLEEGYRRRAAMNGQHARECRDGIVSLPAGWLRSGVLAF
jgi:hypothetical protein